MSMSKIKIVSRDRSGLAPSRGGTPRPLSNVRGVCYHHTAGARPSLIYPGTKLWRDVQKMHFARGYSDVAYNFGIGPSGRVYEGRDIMVRGAHSDGKKIAGLNPNVNLFSIVFFGNYDLYTLTDKAKEAALGVEFLMALRLGHGLEIFTHRETDATACPGSGVQRWIDSR